MSKPYLFVLLGYPGSGKSFFVRNLQKKMQLVRLNGDTLRIEMYGSVEELEKYKDIDPSLSKEKVFKALDYAAKQILSAGHSVIYDANNNKRSIREDAEALAKSHSAIPVVIWVDTPKDLALKRTQYREETVDQRRWEEEKALEVIERHIANTDEPGEDENLIKIDGTIPFEKQYESFKSQLAEIRVE